MFSVTFTETFQDAGQFADFAAAFKDFCDDYYSGSPRRKRAATLPTAPPAVPPATIPTVDTGHVQFAPVTVTTEHASVQEAVDVAAAHTPPAAEPKKRIRRTREQIAADEAAKVAAKAAPAPLDLPKAHGGGNTGTTAPLPAEAPMPVEGETLDIPEGEVTIDDVRRLWSQTLMIEATEADALALLSSLGLSRARDAQPQHYRPLCEGLAAIAKRHGK